MGSIQRTLSVFVYAVGNTTVRDDIGYTHIEGGIIIEVPVLIGFTKSQHRIGCYIGRYILGKGAFVVEGSDIKVLSRKKCWQHLVIKNVISNL